MTFPSGTDNLGWWDSSSWAPNGVPGVNDDVIITGNSSGLQWLHLNNGPDVMKANSLVLDNACFDINRGPSDWTTSAPSLEITTNLTSNGNKENYFLNTNYGTSGKGFKYIKVGENFNVNNTTATYLGWSSYETFSKSNLSLTIGGVINMAENTLLAVNSGSDNYGSTFVDMYAKIGGLNGTNAVIANRDTAARLSYIIFGENTNGVFAGGDFTGRFTKNFDNADLGLYVLEMDDKSNGGNAQIIRLTANSSGSAWKDATDITVNVLNGTLLMNNAAGAVITKLDLQGNGTFGVVGATASDNFGQVNVGNMTWAAGTKVGITLDKNSSSADLITASSFAFASGDASDATYEFAFDFVGNEDLEGNSYKIFSKEGGFTDEMVAKFVGTGMDSSLEAVFSAIGNDLYVTFNQIPEPATVAAILGAFALAIAAYKRRK